MSRSFLLSIAAYLVPSFPLGYFWHLVWFAPQYGQLDLYRADVIIPFGLAAMLVQATFFAWIYPRLFGDLDWKTGALRFGVLFATLAWSFLVLPVAAKYRMTSVPMFMMLETAFTALQYAVTAPLIALSWRRR